MKRILIVDEDRDTREIIAALIGEEGYEARTAGSVAEALAALDSLRYDLVLTDSLQSGPDDPIGAALAVAQAADPAPVLLHTAWRGALAPLAKINGFAGVLLKPAQSAEILLHISSAAGHRLEASDSGRARLVQRYFACLEARDWDGLAALCSDDVVYHLPGDGELATTIRGRKAFREFTEQVFAHFPAASFREIVTYTAPEGAACSYLSSWSNQNGDRCEQAGRVLFGLTATSRICRIRVSVNTETILRSLPKGAALPRPMCD